ncbi:MAG: endonuclease III [Sedimentisphaerales bacterium]|nr:endonuclease III [Sedimentisphaerales bacterium]
MAKSKKVSGKQVLPKMFKPTGADLKSAAGRARKILAGLEQLYPDAECALVHNNALELLVATILSAQCTDVRVNKVTPELFKKYRRAEDYCEVERAELEEDIRSTGFYRNKAKNIQAACRDIDEKFGGKVPDNMEDLTSLAGVGRKTANVILGNAFDTPGITTDTHVIRLSRLMGLSKNSDPVKLEFDLMELVPQQEWTRFSHQMILHGRSVCVARKPGCGDCLLRKHCCYGQVSQS